MHSGMRKSGFLLSVGVHAALFVAAMLATILWTAQPLQPVRPVLKLHPVTRIPLPVPRAPEVVDAGGGGASQLPPAKGHPPPPPARAFIPPTTHRREAPQLPMQVALPDAPAVALAVGPIGDPLGELGGGDGLGNAAGIGNGLGQGIGSGAGNGMSLVVRANLLTQRPELIHKVEPEYSDDARRAKIQGLVILRIEVDEDGIPRNIRVMRGVGSGLDEQAIKAVSLWRFRPGLVGDMPVVSEARVEVGFRLL